MHLKGKNLRAIAKRQVGKVGAGILQANSGVTSSEKEGGLHNNGLQFC